MKSVYFAIVSTTAAHPHERALTNLRSKKAFIRVLSENPLTRFLRPLPKIV